MQQQVANAAAAAAAARAAAQAQAIGPGTYVWAHIDTNVSNASYKLNILEDKWIIRCSFIWISKMYHLILNSFFVKLCRFSHCQSNVNE